MEPSLRSSSVRASELRLRRCEKSLHETTQRFVESLAQQDCRISQYADVVFATKKMQKDAWYWLGQGGRQGFLVFQPKQPIVWISDKFRMSFRIHMRVSHHVYQRGSVFLASLDLAEKILRLEDVWQLSGVSVKEKPFSSRWQTLLDFYSLNYKADTFLEQGLSIVPAKYQSLDSAKEWPEVPALMFAQGEQAHRRLEVHFQASQPPSQKKGPSGPQPLFVEEEETHQQTHKQDSSALTLDGEMIATAVPREDLPDTYELWIEGVKKGYGAVQDLELSSQLRQAAKKSKSFQVKVTWNEEFEMFEISSLLSAE